ncbi:MAG: hypothetical protein JO144_11645 [Actinobacteria bacterium]|nr:hypothetical protein [Actinomycetota bacterium]
MFGHSGAPCAPREISTSGTGNRFRSAAFPAAWLALLPAWWLSAGTAEAASYPPALGCSITATADGGDIQVQGMGFRAGAPVRVTAAGRGARTVADSAGSFQARLPARSLPSGTALTAAGPGCTVRTVVANLPLCTGKTQTPPCGLPPGGPGSGSQPPPVLPDDPTASAIPVVPLAHVPSHLFLGLAGAVLLAGAGLTGLTGRWGHRAEGRPSRGASVSGAAPVPDSL